MKINIELQKAPMKEREVRESIERATAFTRHVEAQRGRGDLSHEKVREKMVRHAEKDHREGKI